MIEISTAGDTDLDDLVRLESQLFQKDAGEHDPGVDLTWPTREARDDFVRLIGDDASLVLLARSGPEAVGHLVGYVGQPSATRHQQKAAELRSLYVIRSHRRARAGGLLVQRFLEWAREHGCSDARVLVYTENTPAQRFYRQLGFLQQSVLFRVPLKRTETQTRE